MNSQTISGVAVTSGLISPICGSRLRGDSASNTAVVKNSSEWVAVNAKCFISVEKTTES